MPTDNKPAADDFENILTKTWKISINESLKMANSWKHCGKWRNCSFWAISPFATMFSKFVCVRKCLYEGKGSFQLNPFPQTTNLQHLEQLESAATINCLTDLLIMVDWHFQKYLTINLICGRKWFNPFPHTDASATDDFLKTLWQKEKLLN